jgi:hypothetical protein
MTSAATNQETPLTAESNPPGDIPDTQAFVKYRSSSKKYEIDVPEGWARSVAGASVIFTDKYDGESATAASAQAAPAANAHAPEVQAIGRLGRAVEIRNVRHVLLPSGSAVLVDFRSNSEANPVTGKRVRLENNRYFFFKNGRLVILTLWAPLGADNVDQWRHIAHSFRWM